MLVSGVVFGRWVAGARLCGIIRGFHARARRLCCRYRCSRALGRWRGWATLLGRVRGWMDVRGCVRRLSRMAEVGGAWCLGVRALGLARTRSVVVVRGCLAQWHRFLLHSHHLQVCVCVCVCVCVYMHTYIHTCIHAYMSIYIPYPGGGGTRVVTRTPAHTAPTLARTGANSWCH